MEGPFDLFLTLIPIALLIGVQLFASRKKKADEAERAKLASFLARAASGGEPKEKEFDAHALVPDDDDAVSAPSKFYARTVPPYPYDKIERAGAASPAVPPVVSTAVRERMAELSPIEVIGAPVQAHPAPKPTVPAIGAADRLLAKLDRLSPLKRAVVMAEVLGKPKGL